MTMRRPVVSVGLPVRNGVAGVERAVRSVLEQTHTDLELIISDNSSEDATEAICRDLVRADSRVRYHRHPENIGLLNNFMWVMRQAAGTYFKWVGHDDWLEPSYLERCLDRFVVDERLVLVTTQQSYTGPDGVVRTRGYHGGSLCSDRPTERFAEILRLQNDDYLLLDPLYGLSRREPVAAIPRRNMLHEDEVFAAKMALAGPWEHVPEVLAHRGWAFDPPAALADRLDVARWQVLCATAVQCAELVVHLRRTPLSRSERRRAHASVARLYLGRQRRRAVRGADKLRGRRAAPPAGPARPRRSLVSSALTISDGQSSDDQPVDPTG